MIDAVTDSLILELKTLERSLNATQRSITPYRRTLLATVEENQALREQNETLTESLEELRAAARALASWAYVFVGATPCSCRFVGGARYKCRHCQAKADIEGALLVFAKGNKHAQTEEEACT
jgi:hypothetical protein